MLWISNDKRRRERGIGEWVLFLSDSTETKIMGLDMRNLAFLLYPTFAGLDKSHKFPEPQFYLLEKGVVFVSTL